MKKILLPIDGSPRSARTIEMLKHSYRPDEADVTLLMVEFKDERVEMSKIFEKYAEEAKHRLAELAESLAGYQVHTQLLFGTPGPEIVRYAKKEKFDLIMMTRSSRGPLQKLGSVASYIVKKAPDCDLLIMREAEEE
jgi:nucleotide-binding universal stress UspA family protein